VRGVKGGTFAAALDARGVCVSVKSACSTPGTPSRPVLAVTGDRKNALCSWRVSLSHLTTDDELAGFLVAFDACYKELAA
jgi:cysteine desulfurase